MRDGDRSDERAAPPRPGFRQALTAFRYRNFSLFWTGALLSNTGTWVQNVTVPFVIKDLTNSAAWVGFAAFLSLAPMFLMSPVGGSIADRHPRRSVLLITQAVLAVLAITLAVLWWLGPPPLGVFLVLITISGFVTGLLAPSWQAFVSELVPRQHLLNAVTLNSTQFNAASAFGPAVGGLVLATLGPGGAFALNGVSYVTVLVALVLIRLPRFQPRPSPGRRVLGQLADTFRYARGKPGIFVCYLAVLALAGLGMPITSFFILFARDVFSVSDAQYGLFGAALGVGGVLAAPLIAGPGSGVARSRLAGTAFLVYGLALVTFALAPVFPLALVALAVAGGGFLGIASTLNTTVQLQVDEHMRGKALALYIMFLSAALPLGSLVEGLLAQAVGPRVAVTSMAVVFLAITSWLRWGAGLVRHLDDPGPIHDGDAAHETAGGIAVPEPAPVEDLGAVEPSTEGG